MSSISHLVDKLPHDAAQNVLDIGGTVLTAIGNAIGGPWATGMTLAAGVAKAAALMMRDHGKTIDELIADIRRPRPLDTSWREELEQEIRDKPEKA
jgi:hypothetical protein